MKKNIFPAVALVLFSVLLILGSCKKDFLEKPFAVAFNEDSVFTKFENAQKLVNDLYALRPYYLELAVSSSSNPSTRLNGSLLESATDLGSSLRLNANYFTHKINFGTVLAEQLSDKRWGEDVYSDHYLTIRKGFALLERIDEVPDAPANVKARIKAEAKTMIAFQYFELMKRYGGVPLVTKRLVVGVDDVNIPRSPVVDIYNYIIQLLDEAIAVPEFAARYDGLEFGRLNKAFAYGLKAKAALYIASPLFNSATPYMDFGTNNNLISLGSYDVKRWETAAKFAEDAITYCESNGYALINNPSNTNLNYTISYQYRPNQGNTEVMWATMKVSNPSMSYWTPRGVAAPFSGGFSSNLASLNLIEKYQNKDGSYVNWNNVITTPANDPTAPYKNLDPRFHQSIMYNGLNIYPSGPLQFYNHETAALNGANGSVKAGTQWSHQTRKHVYGFEDRAITQKTWQPLCPIMRLTELYMIYAEAKNESLTLPDNTVYSKINAIRNRSGMPSVSGLSKVDMQNRIRDEWAIEFAFEEYRYWDLKRWKMGDVFKGPIYDARIIKNNNNTYTYTKYKYEDRPFFDWYYLHPFPPAEVNLQYGLIQNPGW